MKLKLFGLLMGVAMLAGCSLAQPDTGAATGDRLVGAVVTTEYIHVETDFTVTASGEIRVDESQRRIEGVPVYTEGTDRLERVEFPGVEGYTLLLYRYEKGNEGYVSTVSDDEFYDLGIHSNVTDEGETNTIRGTIQADITEGGIVHFYTNPIYQTPEGGFYLVPGSGISADCGEGTDFKMSQSVDEQLTETVGDESTTSGGRVEVTFECGYPGEKFTLLQLDGENHIIQEESWLPESLPERAALEPDTRLVVLETHYTDRQGKTYARAEAIGAGQFDTDEEGVSRYTARLSLPGTDGVCQVKMLTLEINQ